MTGGSTAEPRSLPLKVGGDPNRTFTWLKSLAQGYVSNRQATEVPNWIEIILQVFSLDIRRHIRIYGIWTWTQGLKSPDIMKNLMKPGIFKMNDLQLQNSCMILDWRMKTRLQSLCHVLPSILHRIHWLQNQIKLFPHRVRQEWRSSLFKCCLSLLPPILLLRQHPRQPSTQTSTQSLTIL